MPASTSWPSPPSSWPSPKASAKGETLTLRQVTRLDKGRQVHVLTGRQAGDLPAADVIYRMGSRWREENYFRYGRAHFALDALDTYAVTAEDPDRKVPNPAKKKAAAAVKTAKKNLAAAQAAREAKLTALRSPAPGQPAVVITNQMLARLDAPVAAARRKLEDAQAAARAIPAKIPLSEHNPDMVRLDTETKLITHAIRMAAYNAETILARALDGGYARAGDEAYALIREALTTSGDIIPGSRHPHHPPGPAIRTPPHPRPGRPLRPAQHHQDALPRHQAHPAIRGQRTPEHYMIFCAMSGALGMRVVIVDPRCSWCGTGPSRRSRLGIGVVNAHSFQLAAGR